MKKTFFVILWLWVLAGSGLAAEHADPQVFSGPVTVKNKPITYKEISSPTTTPATGSWYLYFTDTGLYTKDDAGTSALISSSAATKWDEIRDPTSAGTIAMGAYDQTLTSTKTNADMFVFKGLGAFGDVSVMRVSQLTGNATDGTVLEVTAADANVDPLVVSSSGQSNALVVGQGAGAVSIAGNATVGGALAVTGEVTASNLNTHTVSVVLTAAQVKALRATPVTLVAAGGAHVINQMVDAVFALNYGSEIFSETADNLVIEYADGRDITAAIETTGFIDQNVDQVAMITAADIPTMTAAAAENKAIRLFNTGDGEIGGNASNDSTLTVFITYRAIASGL